MSPEFGIVGSGQQPAAMPASGFFRDVAAATEQAGFDSLWATDHISFVNPILEGMVALSFFAAATRSIRLGTAIYLLALRHPSAVAKQLASLDHLADGRLIFGVGAGGEGDGDFEAVGIPKQDRGARTDESIDVLRALLGGRDVSHHGRFFGFEGVTIQPPPVQSPAPPIWIGGRSEAALRRAGRRGDGWLAYMVSPRRLREGVERIGGHAAEVDRDAARITPAIMLPVRVDHDGPRARREAQRHLSDRYGRPFDAQLLDRYCAVGTPEECIERVGAYLDAGARHVLFNPARTPAGVVDTIELLAAEVLPAVRPSLGGG